MKKYFLLVIIIIIVVTNVHAQTKMSTEDSLRWENFKREQQVIQKASDADYQLRFAISGRQLG